MVEELIVGGDGLVRAANIRTSNGKTNRPIVKLFPLEVSSSDITSEQISHIFDDHAIPLAQPDITSSDDNNTAANPRPTHNSARKAMGKFAEWADSLLPPPPPPPGGCWELNLNMHTLRITLYYVL